MNCFLCNSSTPHHPGKCGRYNTPNSRRARLRELNMCEECGKPLGTSHGTTCFIPRPCPAHADSAAQHVNWLCDGQRHSNPQTSAGGQA